RGDLQAEVGEVPRAQEVRVQRLEDDRHDDEPRQRGQRAELAVPEPLAELHDGGAPAPVMAATTACGVTAFFSKLATRRPSRSTTMRSATSNTSARLWLITTTPRPSALSLAMRSSTWRVCATPSAA